MEARQIGSALSRPINGARTWPDRQFVPHSSLFTSRSDIAVRATQMMAPQKRSAAEAESLLVGVKAIIFDIEGTTTPITFVKVRIFMHLQPGRENFALDGGWPCRRVSMMSIAYFSRLCIIISFCMNQGVVIQYCMYDYFAVLLALIRCFFESIMSACVVVNNVIDQRVGCGTEAGALPFNYHEMPVLVYVVCVNYCGVSVSLKKTLCCCLLLVHQGMDL